MLFNIIAQAAAEAAPVVEAAASGVHGNLVVMAAAITIPIGISIIGYKACESVGRNPGASTKILVQSIIAMAFAEAIIFFAIFLG